MKYLSVKEIAKRWGISERRIRTLCKEKSIESSILIGNSWGIPEDAKRPIDKRKTKNNMDNLSKRNQYGLNYNYIIIHGTFGYPGENWFPWLAKEISKLDKTDKTTQEDIIIPHFPSSYMPNYDSWKSILMGYLDGGLINKNTIVIGHSLGPLFISRFLIETKTQIKGLISVEGANLHFMGNDDFDNINKTFFISWEELEKVKKYVEFNYCFYTDNDPYIPFNVLKEYVDRAATRKFFIENAGHFNTLSGYIKFPQLLELIKDIEEGVEIKSNADLPKLYNSDSWNKDLAHIWTNMVPPSRVSISELAIYTKYLRKLQEEKKEKLKMLVLGSTVEYRDWGYEEDLTTYVMNNNEEYHLASYRELKHKNAEYQIILRPWQEIDFNKEFDLIVGDLCIGNVDPLKLEEFLKNVSKSLNKNGLFLSKSIFGSEKIKYKTIEEIFNNYDKNLSFYHPYSATCYDLSMICKDIDNMLDFKLMYKTLKEANKNGIITNKTFAYFENLGLQNEMQFKFHIPYLEDYTKLVKKYFKIVAIENSDDVYKENIPLYILTTKDSDIY